MKYDGAHYVVTAPTATGVKVLSGDPDRQRLEPAAELFDVRMEHRSGQRTALRNGFKEQYYSKLLEIEEVKRF